MNKETFFFLGCWNNVPCKNYDNIVKNNRSNILDLIEKNIKKYDFGVLGGDNIYPMKLKDGKSKYKIYYRSSINYINRILDISSRIRRKTKKKNYYLGKKLHVILGNHDYKKKNFKIQKKLFLNKNSKLYDYNNYFTSKYADYHFLDTNNLLLLNDYLKFIDTKNKNKWIILIGHEPILSLKDKKNDLQILKEDKINYSREIINRLKELDYPKMIYICADTHNFQFLNLQDKENNFDLPIIIAGTGGANPDDLKGLRVNKDILKDFNIDNIRINKLLEPYGYLSFNIYKNKVIFSYIQCDRISSFMIRINKKNKLIISEEKYDKFNINCSKKKKFNCSTLKNNKIILKMKKK